MSMDIPDLNLIYKQLIDLNRTEQNGKHAGMSIFSH